MWSVNDGAARDLPKNPLNFWCIFGKNEQIGSIFSPKLTLCGAESTTNLVLFQETHQGEFLVVSAGSLADPSMTDHRVVKKISEEILRLL
jgi:hypothetical protein